MSYRFDLLVRPCAHCPFRLDVPGYIDPERAREIGLVLLDGYGFPCHETTKTVEVVDEDGLFDGEDTVADHTSSHCVGALLFLIAQKRLNVMMLFAMSDGWNPDDLKRDVPVVDSLEAFVAHHSTWRDTL